MQTQSSISNNLLKEFSIDTKDVQKRLSIYRGNLLGDDSRIVVVPVYDYEETKGQLYRSFLDSDPSISKRERRILAGLHSDWVGTAPYLESDRHFFFIHSESEEGREFTIEHLHRLLKLTFSAISAFLYEGNEANSIALPVIFRKGIPRKAYREFIHLFLFEASRFLKRIPSTKTVKIFIWNEEDAVIWEEVISAKTVVESKAIIGPERIKKSCNEIQAKLVSGPLRKMLSDQVRSRMIRECKRDQLDVAQFTYAVYLMIRDLLNDLDCMHGFPSDWNQLPPWRKVIALKSNRLLVEWLGEYMSSVLTFNRLVKEDGFIPSLKELYIYQLQVFQILSFFEKAKGSPS